MAAKLGVELVSLDELLARSDFITIHTPKTKDTAKLLNKEAFMKMKPGVRLINCARGGLIDEAALLRGPEGRQGGRRRPGRLSRPSRRRRTGRCGSCPTSSAPRTWAPPPKRPRPTWRWPSASRSWNYLLYGTIKNAVNAPSVSQEAMGQLKPYLTLAEALGAFQAQISEGAITSVSMAYVGEVSKLDTKPLTHSILKGLLFPVVGDEVNYVNAPAMAASRGIHISEEKVDARRRISPP